MNGAAQKTKRAIIKYAGGGLEQAVYALQNFLLTVIAARGLPTDQFAKYVVEIACVLLCFALTSTLLNAPMLVLIHKVYSQATERYLQSLRVLAVCLSLFVPLVLALAIFGIEGSFSWINVLSMSVLHYSMLSYDLCRRHANAAGRTNSLAVQTTSGTILCFAIAAALTYLGWLTNSSLQLAFAAPFGLLALAHWLNDWKNLNGTPVQHTLLNILKRHFEYSWALLISMTLYWVSTQGYFIVAAMALPELALGGLRSAQSLCGALNVLFLAFENRATPAVAKKHSEDASYDVASWSRRSSLLMLLPLLGTALLLVPLLWFAHKFVFGDKYAEYSYLVLYFIAYLVGHGLSRPYAVGLKVLEKNRAILYGYAFSAAACVGLAYPLIQSFGVSGAAVGFMLSSFVQLLVLSLYSSRQRMSNSTAILEPKEIAS